jgi:hypothetical protein
LVKGRGDPAVRVGNDFLGFSNLMDFLSALEPIDSEKEKIGIKALQYKELTTVNHSVCLHRLPFDLSNICFQF